MADTCSVDGCEKPVRSGRASLCGMHYHRQYRHGSVHALGVKSGITASKGRRYVSTHAPGHPLSDRRGRAYEHRLVLFEKIGYGPHLCHWCSKAVNWRATGSSTLQTDHLNGWGDDNSPDNLVPCCPACNTKRAHDARHALLVAHGFWSVHDTVAATAHGRPPAIEAA